MTLLPYEVVDVFTDRAFAGNPIAVVCDAADPAAAREHGVSHITVSAWDPPVAHARMFAPGLGVPEDPATVAGEVVPVARGEIAVPAP